MIAAFDADPRAESPRRRFYLDARGKVVTGALLFTVVVLAVAIALGVHRNKHTGSELAGTHTGSEQARTHTDSEHAVTSTAWEQARTHTGSEHAGTCIGREQAGTQPQKEDENEAGGDEEGEKSRALVDSMPRARVEEGGKVVYIGRRWKDEGGKLAARSGMKIQFDYEGVTYIVCGSQATQKFLEKQGTLEKVVSLLSNPPRMVEGWLHWGAETDSETFFMSEAEGRHYEVHVPKDVFGAAAAGKDFLELDKARGDLEALAVVTMRYLLTRQQRLPGA